MLRQTRFSANQYWTNILYQVPQGNTIETALELTQDSNTTTQNVAVRQGVPFWIKWTVLYNDQMDFYTCLNGLLAIPNSLSNYVVYQPDGVTTIDLSNSHVYNLPSGSGPDPLTRETDEIFINYLFQSGHTYYLKYFPPLSGSMGMYMYGD